MIVLADKLSSILAACGGHVLSMGSQNTGLLLNLGVVGEGGPGGERYPRGMIYGRLWNLRTEQAHLFRAFWLFKIWTN